MILYFIFVLEILKDILEKNMERALFLLEKSNLNPLLLFPIFFAVSIEWHLIRDVIIA